MPSMRVLAELKDAGAFGTIMHVEGNYSHDWLANYPADSWRMAAEESRAGGMTGMGIHVLDCFRDLVGPDEADQRAFEGACPQVADGRYHLSADRIRERRDRHAWHHDQDAVPLAHRGFRRELLGGKRQRDAGHRALRRQERSRGDRTASTTIISAATSIISRRPCSGRAHSRFHLPASCRRQQRSKPSSNRRMPTAPG